MKKNNYTLEELIKHSRSVKLSENERSEMRHSIFDSADTSEVFHIQQIHTKREGSLFSLLFKGHMKATVVAGFMVVIMGGSVIAAEGSAPGDVLYPVKTEVNERVAGMFSVSTEARAEYQSRLADRRAEEIIRLASENRLDPQARASIEARFDDHISRLSEQVIELESRGNVEAAAAVSSDFETKMNARKTVLADLDDRTEEVSHFSASIDKKLDSVIERREGLEARVAEEGDVDVRMENALRIALENVEKAKEAIERARDRGRVSSEAIERAETHLKNVESVVSNAEKQLENGEHGEAFLSLRRAQRMAGEVNLVLQSRTRLNIDVKSTTLLEVEVSQENEEGNEEEEEERDQTGQEGDEGIDGDDLEEEVEDGEVGTSTDPVTEIDEELDQSGQEGDGSGSNSQDSVEVDGSIDLNLLR